VNGDPPVYAEIDFTRRFRLPRIVFDCVYRDLLSEQDFQQRLSATSEPQASTLQKMTAALRVLAFGVANDSADEYVRLSESTVCETVHRFARFVVEKYQPVYHRKPTLSDLQRVLSEYEKAGFPGCMGCVDYSHWVWKNCPMSLHGQYQGKSMKRSIGMETVADKDLYLWHLCIGLPGEMNNLVVMAFFPLFQSMLVGSFPPPISYTVNRIERTFRLYLCDGMYP